MCGSARLIVFGGWADDLSTEELEVVAAALGALYEPARFPMINPDRLPLYVDKLLGEGERRRLGEYTEWLGLGVLRAAVVARQDDDIIAAVERFPAAVALLLSSDRRMVELLMERTGAERDAALAAAGAGTLTPEQAWRRLVQVGGTLDTALLAKLRARRREEFRSHGRTDLPVLDAVLVQPPRRPSPVAVMLAERAASQGLALDALSRAMANGDPLEVRGRALAVIAAGVAAPPAWRERVEEARRTAEATTALALALAEGRVESAARAWSAVRARWADEVESGLMERGREAFRLWGQMLRSARGGHDDGHAG